MKSREYHALEITSVFERCRIPLLNGKPWRMNLLAFSEVDHTKMFIAMDNQILMYQWRPPLEVPGEPKKKVIIGDAASDFSTDSSPYTINAIRIGWLGREEVLVSVHENGNARVWFTSAFERAPLLFTVDDSAWSAATHGHRRLLAISANSHNITLFRLQHNSSPSEHPLLATGAERVVLRGHTHNIPNIDFSPCGRYLVSCSIDGTCRVWDVETAHTIACQDFAQIGRLVRDQQWGWSALFIEKSAVKHVANANLGFANPFVSRGEPFPGFNSGRDLRWRIRNFFMGLGVGALADEVSPGNGSIESADGTEPEMESEEQAWGDDINLAEGVSGLVTFETASLSDVEMSPSFYASGEDNLEIDLNEDEEIAEGDGEMEMIHGMEGDAEDNEVAEANHGERESEEGSGTAQEIGLPDAHSTSSTSSEYQQAEQHPPQTQGQQPALSAPLRSTTAHASTSMAPASLAHLLRAPLSDYAILYTTKLDLFLLNAEDPSLSTLYCERAAVARTDQRNIYLIPFDRLNMIQWIPELSLVVAASQKGRVGLFRVVRICTEQEREDRWLIHPEMHLPGESPPHPLLGVFVSKPPAHDTSLARHFLHLIYLDGSMFCYEIMRRAETNPARLEWARC
ncbi:uncharacterized protein VTP21DRAFT_5560 [Calcarisporiella thermophila]|uniref:uncharacterized protein n=1 Tax=Calcarisporiella thermophila TaxID=911321 RepID=UPI003742B5DE